MNTHRILLTLALAAFSGPGIAQQAGTAATPAAKTDEAEPSVEEVKKFLIRIDSMIKGREERATRLANEMRERDKRLEAGIKSLVTSLEKATDSQQSRTRVAKLKAGFIEDLGKAAQAYARKRAELEQSLREEPNQYTRDQLFAARGKIDERVNKRVDDIVGLAATFDTHQDLEKYRVTSGGSDWNGGWDSIYEDNPAYEQNKRATRAGNQARDQATGELDKAVERLDLRVRSLQESLKAPNLTVEKRKLLEDELARVTQLRDTRAAQRDSLLSGVDQAPTRGLSLHDAMAMEDHLETEIADLRQEFQALFNAFRDWKTVQAQLGDYIMRRDRAAAWMEKKEGK